MPCCLGQGHSFAFQAAGSASPASWNLPWHVAPPGSPPKVIVVWHVLQIQGNPTLSCCQAPQCVKVGTWHADARTHPASCRASILHFQRRLLGFWAAPGRSVVVQQALGLCFRC